MQPGYFDVDLDGTDLRIINNTLRNNEQYGPYIGQMVSEPDKVVTLDGVKRLILTVNGQFPAPPLEVKEGAQVSKAPATLSNASNMSDLRYVRSSDLMSNILESFSNGSLICISHSSWFNVSRPDDQHIQIKTFWQVTVMWLIFSHGWSFMR